MTQDPIDLEKEISDLLEKHFLQYWRQFIEEQNGQLQRLQSALLQLPSSDRSYDDHQLLTKLVHSTWPQSDEVLIRESLSQFDQAITGVLQQTDPWQVVEQPPERFEGSAHDGVLLRIGKRGKKLLFVLSTLHLRLLNLFGRSKRPIPYWLHSIPEHNLAMHHFQQEMLMDCLPVIDELYRELSAGYRALKQQDDTTHSISDFHQNEQDAVANILGNELFQRLSEQVSLILVERSEMYQIDFQKAGTWELPNNRFSTKRLKDGEEQAHKKWTERHLEWHNTLIALLEEWRLDTDLRNLILACQKDYDELHTSQVQKIGEQIDPIITAIDTFIDEAVSDIEESHSDLGKVLKTINYRAEKKLKTDLVPTLTEKLANQHLAGLINRLELSIQQHVGGLTEPRAIVKTSSYDQPLESKELRTVSPHDLISFEALAEFKVRTEKIRHAHFKAIDGLSKETADVGHVVSYSCESAIEALKDPTKSKEEVQQIALQGIRRAKQRLQDARSQLDVVIGENDDQLSAAILQFNERVLELTVNENVSNLRLRIAKAKAAQKAQAWRNVAIDKLRSLGSQIKTAIKNTYGQLGEIWSVWSERFILTARRPSASREISDFLIESQHAIQQLPPIYRRLYKIEPLEELELFEGRQQEIAALKAAYANWRGGRNAATAIIGEKWGGLTTFINYLVQQEQYPHIVCRYSPGANYCDESYFLQELGSLLNEENLDDLQALITYLNTGNKRVIIIEDLQNLYLRKVGGFQVLQGLFQLITQTSGNIFWITSSTLYAWEYLKKTLHIHEYFSYTVRLETLSSEQIISIIWKRNRISGFKIHFEEDESLLQERRYRRLSTEERQTWLRDSFFRSLNDFANSNVSLALIFWLLSTKKVDETTITIGTFHKPDLNFISVLSMDKVYVLHALILHDGLRDEQLCEVLNTSLHNARLNALALLEDGIIVKEGDSLVVNPIVYRNTLNMLKSRNFIH